MDCRYSAAAARSVAVVTGAVSVDGLRGGGVVSCHCAGEGVEKRPVQGPAAHVSSSSSGVGRRGIEPGCLGVGLGSGQDGQAPHQCLTLVEVDGWVDRPDHVGDGVEPVPRGHGVVDRGDQGGPPGARGQVVRAVVPEVFGELAGPAWCEVVLVVEVHRDGGGEVAADAPPERGGGMVVGKVALGEGGTQEGWGVEATRRRSRRAGRRGAWCGGRG